jgi:hypothetical protein
MSTNFANGEGRSVPAALESAVDGTSFITIVIPLRYAIAAGQENQLDAIDTAAGAPGKREQPRGSPTSSRRWMLRETK